MKIASAMGCVHPNATPTFRDPITQESSIIIHTPRHSGATDEFATNQALDVASSLILISAFHKVFHASARIQANLGFFQENKHLTEGASIYILKRLLRVLVWMTMLRSLKDSTLWRK